jgi:hypothetical protein
MLSTIEYIDSIFGLTIPGENHPFNQSFTVQDLSCIVCLTMPVPDQLMFQVSRSLTLRLAIDLDSESAHHAYSASLTLETRGQQ